eukprot:UN03514
MLGSRSQSLPLMLIVSTNIHLNVAKPIGTFPPLMND